MTATPPIVDRENLAEADRHAARQGEGARERTRLARSRSSTPSRSRSQQFALGSVGGSACETDLAECATWISFGSRSSSTLTIRSRLVDGGPRPWDGLSWATPRTSSRSGRLRIGCPGLLFVPVPEEKAGKNRLHPDFRPVDQTAEVERLLSLGARRADVGQRDASWVVLADPEGNEFCILSGRVRPDS